MKKMANNQLVKESYETPQIEVITMTLQNTVLSGGGPVDTDPEEQI